MDIDIRVMTIEDYDKVYALWKTIGGFGLRSMGRFQRGYRPVPEGEIPHQHDRMGWG